MIINEFSPIQLDALREVSNIGAGNATTALATLLNKKIDMTVPSVNIIELTKLLNDIGDETVVGIIVRVLGEAPGNILLVFEEETSSVIIKSLAGQALKNDVEMAKSILCELGNIISTSYMNSIAQFTGLNIYPSVPGMANDMLNAILSTVFVESEQYDDIILDIETVFLDENGENLGAHFYYIPVPGSLEKILKSIGVI